MKTIPLLAAALLAFSTLTARAATMTLSSHPGVDVTATFTFSPASLGAVSSAFKFETAKGLLGPSNNPSDQSGFKNSAKDLFAITVIPATKSAFVHFFLTTAKGDIHLVADVNGRVAKLLPPPWRADAKEFLRVETIQSRKVKLSTTDFAHAPFKTHTFWVKVDTQGGMTLVP